MLTVTAENDGPSISDVSDQETNEDTATSSISFSISDVDSNVVCQDDVTGVSSNSSVVITGGIVVS